VPIVHVKIPKIAVFKMSNFRRYDLQRRNSMLTNLSGDKIHQNFFIAFVLFFNRYFLETNQVSSFAIEGFPTQSPLTLVQAAGT